MYKEKKTEGAIKNGQSREAGNIGYTKQKHNTLCVGHDYTEASTTDVNNTWSLQQTTVGKNEPNIVSMQKL